MKFSTLLLPVVTLSAVVSALPSSTTSTMSNGDLTSTVSAPATPSSSETQRLSNAERLMKGLPLKAPSRRSLLARQPAPSPTPCGRLFVLASDGSYDGYISAALDAKGRYFVTPNPALAINVLYSNSRLYPSNGESEFPIIGATFGDYYDGPNETPAGVNNFAGNSGNFAVISGTSDTPNNSPPQQGSTSYVDGPENGIEAAIFRLDPENKEILPTWINMDGSPHLSTFGMPAEGIFHPIVISQNIGSYNAVNEGYSARVFCVGSGAMDDPIGPLME